MTMAKRPQYRQFFIYNATVCLTVLKKTQMPDSTIAASVHRRSTDKAKLSAACWLSTITLLWFWAAKQVLRHTMCHFWKLIPVVL